MVLWPVKLEPALPERGDSIGLSDVLMAKLPVAGKKLFGLQ